MQNLTGDHDDFPAIRKLSKQCDHLGSRHWIETIQRFVQYQHIGLMTDCLGKLDSLTHAFAVCIDRSLSGGSQVDSATLTKALSKLSRNTGTDADDLIKMGMKFIDEL